MATLLSDVDWVESTVRYDDDGPLKQPWFGADTGAERIDQPDTDFYVDIEDQGEYHDAPAQQQGEHRRLHNVVVALNTLLAVIFGIAQVALLWRIVVALNEKSILPVVFLAFSPLILGKIQQKAGNRRLTVYYRRMLAATLLVVILAMGYHWTRLAPMESPVIYLAGMGVIMFTFLVTVVAAVVLVPKKS